MNILDMIFFYISKKKVKFFSGYPTAVFFSSFSGSRKKIPAGGYPEEKKAPAGSYPEKKPLRESKKFWKR
jgi:hypothetical protein